MGISLSPDRTTGWSVAADHYVCKYRIFDSTETKVRLSFAGASTRLTLFPGHSENGAIRDYCTWERCYRYSQRRETSCGCWMGWRVSPIAINAWRTLTICRTRLYSTKSGRPLAVLSYHRSSLHALAFAPLQPSATKATTREDDDDSDDEEESAVRPWLAAGGKDATISLWEVYPPE